MPLLHDRLEAVLRFSALEGQLCNSRFVEFTKSFCDHPIVLRFRGAGEGQGQPGVFREMQRDAAILGRVRGGKKTGVIAVLHVFAIGLQNAGTGAG